MTRRWQDSDVRDRPDLREVVGDYLVQYTGDFPYLVEARKAYASGNRLRVPVVRGVLNCMMGDSKVVNMPEPIDNSFDARPKRRIDFYDDELSYPADLEDEPQTLTLPPPTKAVPLKVTWKVTHAVINHKVSRVLHMIDPSTSIATWRGEYDEIRWQIGLVCKSRATYFPPLHGAIFLLGYNQAHTTLKLGCLTMSPRQFNGHEMKGGLVRDWRECKQCLMLSESPSILEGPRRTS